MKSPNDMLTHGATPMTAKLPTDVRERRCVQRLVLLLYIAAILMVGYHSLSFGVWQFRNPKANAMTFYSHYLDVIAWNKLPEFQ